MKRLHPQDGYFNEVSIPKMVTLTAAMNIPSLYKSNSYVNFLPLSQTIPKMVTSSPRWLPQCVDLIPKMVTLPPQDGYLTTCKPLPHKALRNLKVLKTWCYFKNNTPLVVFFRDLTLGASFAMKELS